MEFKKLNNNEKLPFVSYGVYEIKPKKTKEAVLNALETGYRAIDGAQVYYNEKRKWVRQLRNHQSLGKRYI